jgi:hypothetical protein
MVRTGSSSLNWRCWMKRLGKGQPTTGNKNGQTGKGGTGVLAAAVLVIFIVSLMSLGETCSGILIGLVSWTCILVGACLRGVPTTDPWQIKSWNSPPGRPRTCRRGL